MEDALFRMWIEPDDAWRYPLGMHRFIDAAEQVPAPAPMSPDYPLGADRFDSQNDSADDSPGASPCNT